MPGRLFWVCVGLVVLCCSLAACVGHPPGDTGGLRAATPIPTLDSTHPDRLCGTLLDYRGRDWAMVIYVLEILDANGIACGEGFNPAMWFYEAYTAYGQQLEQSGLVDSAVTAYWRALEYHPTGLEAQVGLESLGVFVPQLLETCPQEDVNAALSALPTYTPETGEFVQITNGRFTLSGQPYPVYGINYYPRDYPYQRFLTEMHVEHVALELELIRDAGINTLRIYLQHNALFQCPGNGAVPISENIARLDAFIRLAAQHGYKLILVLHNDTDWALLYDAPDYLMQQMTFVAQRYRDEPAVMAYDLRDSGDRDYTDNPTLRRESVIAWLAQAGDVLRQNAPKHLVTTGWQDNAEATAPVVDFISFQHFSGDIDALRQEIAILTGATRKPILLAATGYSTYEMDEVTQRQLFQRVFEAVERNALAGWVVWTAFDYPLSTACLPPDCPAPDSTEVHFGLWNTSYFPKRALEIVRLTTGAMLPEIQDSG